MHLVDFQRHSAVIAPQGDQPRPVRDAVYHFDVQVPSMHYVASASPGRLWPVPWYGDGRCYGVNTILAAVVASLKPIPGIRYANAGNWFAAPYDAAWIVQGTLRALSIPFELRAPNDIHTPRPWGPEAEQALIAAIVDNEWLRSWLVEPGGPFTLAPFQRFAIWEALESDGRMFDIPPGGGKTVCAAVFSALGPPGPVLHVTKNSVTTQYARAIAQFIRCRPYELPAQSRAPVRDKREVPLDTLLTEYLEWADYQPAFGTYTEGPPHVVIGWDTLRHVADALKGVPWATIVYDESHYAQSSDRFLTIRYLDHVDTRRKDTRTMVAWELAQATKRVLPMTGTPQPDRRRAWWGQLSLLSNAFDVKASRFHTRYCDAQKDELGHWDTSGTSNTEEFLARKSFWVTTVPQDVVDAQLPPRRLSVVRVSPKNQDKPDKWFREEERRLARLAAKGDKSARALLRELKGQEAAARKQSAAVGLVEDYITGALVARREQEATLGRPLNADELADRTRTKGKIVMLGGRHAEVWELADAVARKFRGGDVDVLCGVTPEADLTRQEQPLPDGGVRKETRAQWIRRVRDGGFVVLDGPERQEVQDAYMAHPGPCVLVGTGQAWGTGLDLQDSDLLVIVYIPDSPGELAQWMRRVQRLGMGRPCQVILLVADQTSDARRVTVLVDKTPDIGVTTGDKSLAEVRDRARGVDEETAAASIAAVTERMELTGDVVDDEEEGLWDALL